MPCGRWALFTGCVREESPTTAPVHTLKKNVHVIHREVQMYNTVMRRQWYAMASCSPAYCSTCGIPQGFCTVWWARLLTSVSNGGECRNIGTSCLLRGMYQFFTKMRGTVYTSRFNCAIQQWATKRVREDNGDRWIRHGCLLSPRERGR